MSAAPSLASPVNVDSAVAAPPMTMVAVEGGIAAGKSSLTEMVAKSHQGRIICIKEPLFEALLKGVASNPKKFGLPLQLAFMGLRLPQLHLLRQVTTAPTHIVIDRGVLGNAAFAYSNLKGDDLEMFADTHTTLVESAAPLCEAGVPSWLQVKPFSTALVHLYVPPPMCAARIVQRGRDYEQTLPIDYLKSITDAHVRIFIAYIAAGGEVPVVWVTSRACAPALTTSTDPADVASYETLPSEAVVERIWPALSRCPQREAPDAAASWSTLAARHSR